MTNRKDAGVEAVVLVPAALDAILSLLHSDGYRVVAPRRREGAIVLDTIESADDLPGGWIDEQAPGRYRLTESGRPTLFEHGPTAQSWKKLVYPAEEVMWRARRRGAGFVIDEEAPPPVRTAILGIRACDLHAIDVLDRVFGPGHADDPAYRRRRQALFIIAVDCSRPGGTCFCASLGTGPRVGADSGADLILSELWSDGGHRLLATAGSARGADVLDRIETRPASPADHEAAERNAVACREMMPRSLVDNVAALLARNIESPHWDAVAARCLSCGNCTLACPTCFCTQIGDTVDLSGDVAVRTRRWDSCFSLDHSYLYGGSVRLSVGSRYRQWITHKLSTWHDQFGVSGCVGCGRCITWCPVGIDITEEARAIRDGEAEG